MGKMNQLFYDIGLGIVFIESIAILLASKKASFYITLAALMTTIIFFIH